MDNNASFSLRFNPLTNVKCVKDYEEEIAALKTENFELKAQIAHSNIPKVLYENKQEMDAILLQKQNLQNNFDNLSKAFENISQEKRLLENKYNQEVALCNEKNSLLEDENKRLILRLEKFNKEIQETGLLKNELNELRAFVHNLERQNEQNSYDHERHFADIKDEYENFKREAEEEIKNRAFEVENLKKKLEMAGQKERNSSFIISDLKATLAAQHNDKSAIDELRTIESMQRAQIEEFQRQMQDYEFKIKNYQNIIETSNKDQAIYLNGMEKFKTIISQKLAGVSKHLIELNEKISRLKAFCFISDENANLILKLKIKYSNLNDLIGFFKEKHAEIYRKMDILRKEAISSTNKPAIDVKTQAILQEFKNQFGEAKNELLICKRYLEKKAAETKELKSENARLMAEIQRTNKNYANGFNKINMMKI